MKEVTVVRNKRTGQVSIIIPKSIADLHEINEKSKVSLQPKEKKSEFLLIIERK